MTVKLDLWLGNFLLLNKLLIEVLKKFFTQLERKLLPAFSESIIVQFACRVFY